MQRGYKCLQTKRKTRERPSSLSFFQAAADVTGLMSEIVSPLSRIRPRCLRVLRLAETSSASSTTMFMYSSKP